MTDPLLFCRLPTVVADDSDALLQIRFYVTFPEAQDKPALLSQGIVDFPVPLDVPCQLLLPEFLVGGDLLTGMFLMPSGVPEVPVNKNRDVVAQDGDIGGSGERPVVLPVAQAAVPEGLAQEDFRLRIPAADAAHVSVPLLLRQDIHQFSSSFSG